MHTLKKIFIAVLLLIITSHAHTQIVQPMRYPHYSFTEQVNIGVSTVRTTAASAYLEVGPTSGATKGLLPPRLTTTERNAIASPAAGLIIYNSTTGRYNYYNGSAWKDMSVTLGAYTPLVISNDSIKINGLSGYGSSGQIPYSTGSGWAYMNFSDSLNDYWRKTGNAGTVVSANAVGTTDSVPIRFITQNYIAGLIGLQTSYSGTNVVWTGASPAGTTFGQTFMGKFAGENWGLTVNSNATVYGHGALRRATRAGFSGITPQMTVIGNNAGFYTYSSNDASGNRSVLVGQMTAYRNFKGANNTYVGTYAGELNNNGFSNTAVGRDAMRSNIDGSNNTAAGLFSLLYNSTGIISIPVSAGGSGYTSATVSISAPLGGSPGGSVTTATATATVNAGAVTAINIVNPGAGYTSDPHTYDFGTQGTIVVTISGDGTGATAGTPVLQSGTGNTSIGVLSHFGNTLGQYNTAVGYNAGSSRGWDDNTFFIGRNAGVDASVTNSYATRLTNAGAIGYNAKVAISNALVLGGTGADQVKVGIGTISPDSTLHNAGSFHQAGNAKFDAKIHAPNLAAGNGTKAVRWDVTNGFVLADTTTGGGGGITGSGTDNYIPKWNGTTALENSLIYDDGTNIGIGDATPSYKLDVNGDIRTTTSFYIPTSSTEGFKDASGNVWLWYNGTQLRMTPPTNSFQMLSNVAAFYNGGGTQGWFMDNANKEFYAIGGTGVINNNSTYKLGIGMSAASVSASLHIRGGQSSMASLKIDNGTKLTTAETGAIEFDNNLMFTKTNNVRMGVGGNLATNTTDAGNTGAGEDDLMTYSIPAGTLSADGDYLEFTMTFTFAANANNKEIKIKYGGTTIYATGAQAQNDGMMQVKGTIIRTGATTQKITFDQQNNTTLFTDNAAYTTAGETLSGAVTLKATGEATSNNDIVQKILTVKYYPSN